jgi:DNA-binding XRE family transcriptional regulator
LAILCACYTNRPQCSAKPASHDQNEWSLGIGRMKKLNVIGRQVGRLRYQRGWTQEMLAARLQLAGWIISRSGVSKIENGSVCIPDFRLPCFAQLFGVAISDLYPKTELRSPIRDRAT